MNDEEVGMNEILLQERVEGGILVLTLNRPAKSQIQALDRTQPGLPMKKGRYGKMTHDYKRNGTTCLFAAIDKALLFHGGSI